MSCRGQSRGRLRFGDVGKGCAQSLRGQGRAHGHHRDRSDQRAPGRDGRLRGHHHRRHARPRRHLHQRNRQHRTLITFEHMQRMKDQAVVANIGHFDNRNSGRRAQRRQKALKRTNIKPQVDKYTFPGRPRNFPALRGPAGEPRQRDGSSELRHVEFVLEPSARSIGSLENRDTCKVGFTSCRRSSTKKFARLHLEKIGVKLTKLSKAQADYLACQSTVRLNPSTTVIDL